MDTVKLAENLGFTKNSQMDDLFSGEEPITEHMAFVLSEELGSTPQFWIDREANYRADLTRLEDEDS
jgi:HTH-type transcriptional regulator/antitoxin HigA